MSDFSVLPAGYTTDGTYVYDANGTVVAGSVDTSYPTISPDIVAAATQGDSSALSTLGQLASALPGILTGLTAFEMSQVNVARASKGLPPLATAAYGPQVSVGVAPQTMSTILMIAVGLGAVMLLAGGKRR